MLFEIDQEEPKLQCRPINNRSIAEHPLLVTLGLWFDRFGSLLLAAERFLLAHAGFPRPGMCSGHYPVLSGFRQRQLAVPRRAPTYLSHFT